MINAIFTNVSEEQDNQIQPHEEEQSQDREIIPDMSNDDARQEDNHDFASLERDNLIVLVNYFDN